MKIYTIFMTYYTGGVYKFKYFDGEKFVPERDKVLKFNDDKLFENVKVALSLTTEIHIKW